MRNYKKLAIFAAIIALIAISDFGRVDAAALTSVNDLLSDSDRSVPATHTISLTTSVALIAGDYYNVVLPADFGDILAGNITCPANSTSSAPTVKIARCTATSGIATGTVSIIIADVTNPGSAGSQAITISTRNAGDAAIESSVVRVAIIDNVEMSANVPSTLAFIVSPLASSSAVNGATTNLNAATTSLAYGNLDAGVSYVMGQELRVTTNAKDGFSVTVEQNQNLMSGGATIDSFKDGAASTTAVAWTTPSGILDQRNTYGHFGFTSEDTTLAGGDVFGDNLWRGFASSTPAEVFYNGGVADGSAPDKGYTKVGYRLQISDLQETGDYTNILTYIATPSY